MGQYDVDAVFCNLYTPCKYQETFKNNLIDRNK